MRGPGRGPRSSDPGSALEKLGQDIEESVKHLRQRTVEGIEVWKEKYGGGNLTTVFKNLTCIIEEEGIDFFFPYCHLRKKN